MVPARRRSRVLSFVPGPRVDLADLTPREALAQKLGLPPRYFHLPNQFWKHKNHALVIEALAPAPTSWWWRRAPKRTTATLITTPG